MKSFLKKNLPVEYKKSSIVSGEYSMEVASVVRGISIRASEFTEDGSVGWVFYISLAAYDKYDIHDGACLHVLEASIRKDNEEVDLVESAYKIMHWKDCDSNKMEVVLREKIIPWLSRMGDPKEMISFLKAMDEFEDEVKSYADVKKYGSVLLVTLSSHPKRFGHYFNGAIATIYSDLGDYANALSHLKKHREFLIVDNRRNLDDDVFKRRMQMAADGIKELESKV